MKMSKKVFFGAVALLAVSFGFMSCGKDDDEQEMIEGSGKHYTIDYDNDDSATSRGYQSTSFKHYGELVKITFDNSKNNAGVLGFIWDLKTVDGARDFCIVGLATNYVSGEIQYYISKYEGITDIQAQNFGASVGATTGPRETVIKNFTKLCDVSDSPKSIWIDVYPTVDSHTAGVKDAASAFKDGSFSVKISDSEISGLVSDSIKVPANVTGYVGADEEGDKVPQGYLAVYANVYGNSSLQGSWELLNDYADAELLDDEE